MTDLFVRDFDPELHSKTSEIANRDGLTLGSIVNDAVDKWITQRERSHVIHNLVLYSDEESLVGMLKTVDQLTNQNWFRACCGTNTHTGMQFLKKQGWFDGTVEPYSQFLGNPTRYANKVLEKIGNQVDENQLLVMAFLTGDMAYKKSLKKAASFCQWYDKKVARGITNCVADSKNILSGTTEDILELFKAHDQIFIVKQDKLNRIRMNDDNFYSLIV